MREGFPGFGIVLAGLKADTVCDRGFHRLRLLAAHTAEPLADVLFRPSHPGGFDFPDEPGILVHCFCVVCLGRRLRPTTPWSCRGFPDFHLHL